MDSVQAERFKEQCIKELSLRTRWMQQHTALFEQYQTAEQIHNHTEMSILEFIMKAGMETTSVATVARGYNNMKTAYPTPIPGVKNLRHGHTLASTGLGDPQTDPRLTRPDTDLTSDPIMRPRDPASEELLNRGSEGYLRKRNKMLPEVKYYFPESTNWEYGWRLHENQFFSAPAHGRCIVMKPDRVGPAPDPPYYSKPLVVSNAPCVMDA